jgi:anti-anti-sigma regulatory factor
MTTAPAPLLATLPRRRPRRRAPAERTTVVPLEGELEAELGVRLCRDTTLVLDLRSATFLGAGAARLLLDLRSQAAASGVRLVLWRPEGQPFRTLRIVRFDRVFELRPASWRPLRSRDWTVAQPERRVDVRAG